jgi:hypothetical protein
MNGVSLLPRAGDAVSIRRASGALALAERDVLTRESALKASAPGSSHTTYRYELGPDGKRYIVGAEVSIIATEDELDSIPGIRTLRTENKPRQNEDNGSRQSARNPNDDEISRLLQTEREVIAHENAHKAAAGRFGGPVRYTYTTGPDGRRYIVGGEVPIHTPATDDPEEALRNARQVMRAALAPGDPSGQDIAAAANAASTAMSARARIASGKNKDKDSPASARRNEEIERSYAKSSSPRGLWSRTLGFKRKFHSNQMADGHLSHFENTALDIPAWA